MPKRIITYEEYENVKKIFDETGNKAEVGRRLGMHRSTVRTILASGPTDCKEAREPTLTTKALKKRNEDLENRVDELLENLENARKARGLRLPEKSRKRSKPKTFCRLVIADTHGTHADPGAISALMQDLEHIDVREIMMLGDHLECGGFLAQHYTLGYVAQIDESEYEDDIAATNDLLDNLHKLCPKSEMHMLEGNHEQRVERWCVEKAVQKKSAEWLRRQICAESVLNLKKRGVNYYRMGEKHTGLQVRGTVKLGVSYYTHGVTARKHAAAGHLDKFAGCVFYGHTHRMDTHVTPFVSTGVVGAWCPGCLCTLNPRWKHNDPSAWTHGYILQIINKDDNTFQAVPVPINNGQSYLRNIVEVVN